MRDKILKAIQAAATKIIYSDSRLISAFKERGIKVVSKVNIREISLECPENENFGDYSTNFSMTEYRKLAERTKSHVPGGDKPGIIWAEIASNPIELAKKIVSELEKNPELLEIIKKIEVAGKGFINFYLSEKALLAELDNINRQGNEYGTSSLGKGKTVIVDYSSPNIAKRFGIGHLRSTVIGQSLYNLYKTLGYKVIGDNHLGDWGTQFGTLLYQIDSKGLKTSELTIDELEKLYVEFNAEAKSNEKLWDIARAWFKKLEEKDPKAREIWEKVVDISLKEFERIYDILGVNIDYAYGESSYLDKMNGVIEEIRESGLLTKSQGAEIIEFKDLPPAIVVKSDGATTYLARDLAAIRFRIGEWKPDIFIYEVGSDQTLYFRQLFETVRLLGWKGNSEFVHVAHGLIRFEHGK
ncbi:arginine--tRNA ligase, partial [Candidatus Woesebacteria bacterium RIFOXYD1_FULL_46_19]